MPPSLHTRSDPPDRVKPLVIPRPEHPISRKMIDEDALKVLYRLHRHGYLAYLVGGSVRDLLLGRPPKDFDVATDARPHEIRALFKNSRIIGRRFRLVHVFFGKEKIVEVSTFRSHAEFEEIETEEGQIVRTESFGTPEEDAFRRDLTINGLFYNIADFSVIDYVGGMNDLERRLIRTIGDPGERFQQDPVRMIRTLRHAARTGFTIEDRTYQAIFQNRERIRACSPSRLRDEFLRDLQEGVAQLSLDLMIQTGLLVSLFPDFERVFGDRNPSKDQDREFLLSLFGLVDELVRSGRSVSEPILVALFLVPYLRAISPEHRFLGERERYAYRVQAIQWALSQMLSPFSFTRGTREMASQVLIAQWALRRALSRGLIPKRLRMKKYYRDAVLLFGILAEARKERVPRLLRHTVPSDLLPWWPPLTTRRRRRSGRPPHLLHQNRGEEGRNLRE